MTAQLSKIRLQETETRADQTGFHYLCLQPLELRSEICENIGSTLSGYIHKNVTLQEDYIQSLIGKLCIPFCYCIRLDPILSNRHPKKN